MKKIFLLALCAVLSISLFAGCSDNGSGNNELSKPPLDDVVDYSLLEDPYGTICEFMINPENYQGQNIKIDALGSVIYNFDQNKVVKHIMLGLDPTGCCNASYEVRAEDGKYPSNGSNVTFVGTFTSDGYIELYDWASDSASEAEYDVDTLTMSASELEAYIAEFVSNYETSASAGKKIRIFGHLANQSGYAYLLGLNGDGYQTWYIELHDESGKISFPTVSGNLVNPVEVIGTLSFYLENGTPFACIEVDAVNKVECVFK